MRFRRLIFPGDAPHDWWICALLLAVFFTPTVRLSGNVPVRVEDVLIFGSAAVSLAKLALRPRVPRPDRISACLLCSVLSILLSTVIGAAVSHVPITAKEYMDALRPVKFLIVYWLIRQRNDLAALSSILTVTSRSVFILCAISCAQRAFIAPDSDGLLARLFLNFTEYPEAIARDALANRPFATFNTPTDLAYVATMGLFLGLASVSGRKHISLITAASLILLITAARTFLFSLPIVLLMRSAFNARSFREVFKNVSVVMVIVAVGSGAVFWLMPILNPVASGWFQQTITAVSAGSGDDIDSISVRLENLALAVYTWQNARWFGVATRSMLPDFVDSELILTFHRYGVVGLTTLLSIYPFGYALFRGVKKRAPRFAEFGVMALAITFAYGITQGAIANTRIGVLLFALLGVAASMTKNSSFPIES
jgi:hypothetical protein